MNFFVNSLLIHRFAEAVTRIHTLLSGGQAGGSGLPARLPASGMASGGGLFIAKKIVEAHGGRICLPAIALAAAGVESEGEGKGIVEE